MKFTTGETARILGVPAPTLRRWINENLLPFDAESYTEYQKWQYFSEGDLKLFTTQMRLNAIGVPLNLGRSVVATLSAEIRNKHFGWRYLCIAWFDQNPERTGSETACAGVTGLQPGRHRPSGILEV